MMTKVSRSGIELLVQGRDIDEAVFAPLPRQPVRVRLNARCADYPNDPSDVLRGFSPTKAPWHDMLHELSRRFDISTSSKRYLTRGHAWAFVSDYERDRFIVVVDGQQLHFFCEPAVLYGLMGDIFLTALRWWPIHASAACMNDIAHVFVGDSGSGKTFHLLRLLEAGYSFLSNESLCIAKTCCRATPEVSMKVDVGHCRRFSALSFAAHGWCTPQREDFVVPVRIDDVISQMHCRRVFYARRVILHILGVTASDEHPLNGVEQVFRGLVRQSCWCHSLVGVDLRSLYVALQRTYKMLLGLPFSLGCQHD